MKKFIMACVLLALMLLVGAKCGKSTDDTPTACTTAPVVDCPLQTGRQPAPSESAK